MFNKYFDLIKTLFENVFRSGGEGVRFVDYLYVLGFTLALILCAGALCAIVYGLYKLPAVVYKKLTKRVFAELHAVEKQITSGESHQVICEYKVYEKYESLLKTLKIKRICFAIGIIFIYIPFAIPTVLFIISMIQSCF